MKVHSKSNHVGIKLNKKRQRPNIRSHSRQTHTVSRHASPVRRSSSSRLSINGSVANSTLHSAHSPIKSELPLSSAQNHKSSRDYKNVELFKQRASHIRSVAIPQNEIYGPSGGLFSAPRQRGDYAPSVAFQPTHPTHFIGRIAIAAGLLGVAWGSRYLFRGVQAFTRAYKQTKEHLEPISEESLLAAESEIIDALQLVIDIADEENEAHQRKLRSNIDGPVEVVNSKVMREKYGLGALHLTESEAQRLVVPSEAELYLDAILEKYEFLFPLGNFNTSMTIPEAEDILHTTPKPCLEEVTDRHLTMMRLNHPDIGGSSFLAHKVNEAKELLASVSNSDPEWKRREAIRKQEEEEARKKRLEEFLSQQMRANVPLDENGQPIHPDGAPDDGIPSDKSPKH